MNPLGKHKLPNRDGFWVDPFGDGVLAWHKRAMAKSSVGFRCIARSVSCRILSVLFLALSLLCNAASAKSGDDLVRELLAGDPSSREAALSDARLLANAEKKDLMATLVKTSRDRKSLDRGRALEVLSLINPSSNELEILLANSLNDQNVEFRCSAMKALGTMKLESARSQLNAGINNANGADRRCAHRALGARSPLAGESVATLMRELSSNDNQGYQAAMKLSTIAAPAPLLPLLRDKDPFVRKWSALALGEMGPEAKESVPALAGLLGDPIEEVRLTATAALGNIGPEAHAAVPALARALKDKRFYYHPAIALQKIGPAAGESIPALIEALKNEDSDVRLQVALALVTIDPAKAGPAIPALVDAVRTVEDETGFDETAAVALAKIGKPAAPQLTRLLQDTQMRVRLLAARSLGKIGPAARGAEMELKVLLKDSEPAVKEAARASLRRITSSPGK